MARRLDGPLAAWQVGERGPVVIALHGLGESSRYWGPALPALAADHRVVVMDLLGFGRSPWPELGYTVEHHAGAVAETLARSGLVDQPAVFLAHQAGVPVAMAVAIRRPEWVSAVVALGTPWFRSEQEARRALSAPWWLSRWLVEHEDRARLLCRALCGGHPVVPKVARFFAPGAPIPVIEDAFLHHWQSLSGTLRSCWLEADLPGRHRIFPRPVLALHGDDDRCVPVENLLDAGLTRPWLSVRVAAGLGHNLAWQAPALVADVVASAAASAGATDSPAAGSPGAAAPPGAAVPPAAGSPGAGAPPAAAPPPDLSAPELSVAEAAALARVSRRTVLSWVESGAVEARRQGNRYVVSTSALLSHVFRGEQAEALVGRSWLSPVEAAARLGMSHATLARHTATGLPSHRAAGRRFYLKEELDAWRDRSR